MLQIKSRNYSPETRSFGFLKKFYDSSQILWKLYDFLWQGEILCFFMILCRVRPMHKEHLAVLASSTNGKLVKLLGITDLDSGTGLNQAKAVKNMLDEWSIEQRCVAMCFDTTASNTGKFAGACILLEAFIGHPLLWTSCRHHMPEVILRDSSK